MKNKYLLIDTVSGHPKIRVIFLNPSWGPEKILKTNSRSLLSILKKSPRTFDLKKIKGILVVNGPGEFSSVRQGVVFANTLSFSLNAPIKAVKVGENLKLTKFTSQKIVTPVYSRPPNITKSS